MTQALDLSAPLVVPELASIGLTFTRAALTRGVLAVGGTGSGKTKSVLLPLLTAILRERALAAPEHRSSVVCIDPKHELGTYVRAIDPRVIEVGASTERPLDLFASADRGHLDAGAVVDRYFALSSVLMDGARDGFWRTGARELLRECVSIDLHCLERGGAGGDAHIRRALLWRALSRAVLDAGRITPAEARLMVSPRRPISRYLQLIRLLVRDGSSPLGGASSATLLQRVLSQHVPDLALPALSRLAELSSETASSLSATVAALVGCLSTERVQRLVRLDVLPPLRTTPVLSMADVVRSGAVVLYQPRRGSEEESTIGRAVKAALYDAVLAGVACTSFGAIQRLVALVVDEAQEVISSTGVSDAQFLAVGRAFGAATVFATQSISALRDRLPLGSHDTVRAILTNLATRVQLATTDPLTIDELRPLIPLPPAGGPHLLDVRSPAQYLPGEAIWIAPGGWGIGAVPIVAPIGDARAPAQPRTTDRIDHPSLQRAPRSN
ncbi:MAG: hypothetical protein K2R93_18875 [Gemmatimonadaceae bacterium]|nr:hypothetical protein [Gemmatimonadaceae bacterium]